MKLGGGGILTGGDHLVVYLYSKRTEEKVSGHYEVAFLPGSLLEEEGRGEARHWGRGNPPVKGRGLGDRVSVYL